MTNWFCLLDDPVAKGSTTKPVYGSLPHDTTRRSGVGLPHSGVGGIQSRSDASIAI
jgi:hypothetical protein